MKDKLLTFQRFKEIVLAEQECRTILNKTSDLYSHISIFLRTLTNLDPIGVAGAVDQLLSENKQKREQENILYALYRLYEMILKISDVLEGIDKTYMQQQGVVLTHLYLEHSKEVYNNEKIDWLRNAWANGLIDIKRELDDKAYIFELLKSLPIEQIRTLRFIYEKQQTQSFKDREPADIEEVAKFLNIDMPYAQQICISLQGRGLLHDYGVGRFDYHGPEKFVMTEYVKVIVNYIEEPAIAKH